MKMSRNFIQLGNGKAKCQLCGEKIKTGIPQISHRAYQSSASFHANAKDCFPRSKAHIKKMGCPHCGVVDIDGYRKRHIYEGFECTHCYQPVSADKKTKYYNAEMKIDCEGCGEEIGTKEEIMEDMVEAHKVERNNTVEILCETCYHEQPLGSLREDYEAEGILCSDCPIAGRHVVIRKDHTDEDDNLICPFCHSNKNFKNIPETTYLLHGGKREDLNAESFNVEFNEWADQELMSHGKNISFKDWAEDEGMKHGNTEITDWAQHEDESHDARYGAESFEAESRQNSRIQNLIDDLYDDREIALNKLLKINNPSLQNLISKNAILRDKVGDMTLAQWAEVQNQLKYTLSGRIRTFGAEYMAETKEQQIDLIEKEIGIINMDLDLEAYNVFILAEKKERLNHLRRILRELKSVRNAETSGQMNAEFLYYYILNEKGESPADFDTLEEAQAYVANSNEPLEIYERRNRDDEAYKMDKKMNESFEAEEVNKETRELLTSLMVDFANEITGAEFLPKSKRGPSSSLQYALRDEKEWKEGWMVGVEAGPRLNGMDMRISDISIYSDMIYFTMRDLRDGLDYTTNYEYDNEGVGRPYMDLEQWCKDKIRKEADNLRRKYKLSDVEIEWIRVPEYDDDGEYGEFSIQIRKKEMNAERKKRSGLLSEPFEGTSLDSGDWKGIVVGFGIGLLGLFGYSKLRK